MAIQEKLLSSRRTDDEGIEVAGKDARKRLIFPQNLNERTQTKIKNAAESLPPTLTRLHWPPDGVAAKFSGR
jgi:hypothetical protein